MNSSQKFRDDVNKLCADYLGGVWANLSPEDVRIKTISGGLSNEMFLCSVPSAVKNLVETEPPHVLLRLYGSHLRDDTNRITRDAVVFALLAERKLGPRLYGIFPGGRLEEYIPCRTLRPHELSSPHVSLNIAVKMAQLHCLNMPLTKKPSWLFDNMKEWLDEVTVTFDEHSSQKEVNSVDTAVLDHILNMDLLKEIESLEEAVVRKADEVPSGLLPQVAFCHNDLQGGNILLSTAKPPFVSDGNSQFSKDLLTFIDYEYSAYNYRPFDIANHFMEWTFDYNYKDAPYFKFEAQKWPSTEQQGAFLRRYLSTADPVVFDFKNGSDQKAVESFIEWFQSSVQLHTLSSHLLYSLWSLAQYFNSTIRFGYLDYASTRLSSFLEERRRLIN